MSGPPLDAFVSARLDDYIAETARLCAHPSVSAQTTPRIIEGFAGL